MPARSDPQEISSEIYYYPSRIPPIVMDWLRKDPRSNIILPYLLKVRRDEANLVTSNQFWLVIYSSWPSQPMVKTVEFIVAVTNGPIRAYPIFILTSKKSVQVSDDYLARFMPEIVRRLGEAVPLSRVFATFALDQVTDSFERHWCYAHGIKSVRPAYYSAKFTCCTSDSLSEGKPLPQGVNIRRATLEDREQTARLCWGFASESDPYLLSDEDAWKDATYLTKNNYLWVIEQNVNGHGEITCIVAVSRSTQDVAAITKVYTSPQWRKRGYARLLVHAVCNHLLNEERKHYVVLYVAHDNKAAANVYHQVGFEEEPVRTAPSLVENWKEIGFDREKVVLGHW